jgi:hypothetical protein
VLALLDGWAGKLAIRPVRLGGRDVNALAVSGTSRLAGTCSFSKQVGSHLFVVRVVQRDPLNLGATEAAFLTSCHIAQCKPMEVGAGLPHNDWIGGRWLEGWEIGIKLPCGR